MEKVFGQEIYAAIINFYWFIHGCNIGFNDYISNIGYSIFTTLKIMIDD